jgi:hypothetical protein
LLFIYHVDQRLVRWYFVTDASQLPSRLFSTKRYVAIMMCPLVWRDGHHRRVYV